MPAPRARRPLTSALAVLAVSVAAAATAAAPAAPAAAFHDPTVATLTVTSPAAGAVVSGTAATATVTVESAATPHAVRLFGRPAGSPVEYELAEDLTAPYEFAFDSRRFADGQVDLIASAAFDSTSHPGMVDYLVSPAVPVTVANPAELELVTEPGTVLRGLARVTARVVRPSACEDRLRFDYESVPSDRYHEPVIVDLGPDGTATAVLDLRLVANPQLHLRVRRDVGGCRDRFDPEPVTASGLYDVGLDRPTVTVSPADRTRYTTPITVRAEAAVAAQARSPIRHVRLHDAFLSQVIAVDSTAPYEFVLNPADRPLGIRGFFAVAVDEDGVESVSHEVLDDHPEPPARVRLIAQSPLAFTVTAGARSVLIGTSTPLTVSATPADPRVVPNTLPVEVQSRSAGTNVWVTIARRTLTGPPHPGARASVTVPVAPGINTVYRAVTPGQDDAAATTSNTQTVTVTPTLRLLAPTANGMTVRKGALVPLTARLAPGRPGPRVVLQQRTNGVWRNVTATTATASGGVRVSWRAPRTGTNTVLRFLHPATGRLNTAASPAFTVRLR